MTEITKRIITLQKERGLNDHQLEVGANLQVSSIQAWTKGKKRKDGRISETNPSIDSIIKIAHFFDVSTDYLLGLTNEKHPIVSSLPSQRPETLPFKDDELKILMENKEGSEYFEQIIAKLDTQQKIYVLSWVVGYAQSQGITVEF